MNAHTPGNLHSLQLGQVTDNVDPEDRGRIKVRLVATPMEVWANVVAPSAGTVEVTSGAASTLKFAT